MKRFVVRGLAPGVFLHRGAVLRIIVTEGPAMHLWWSTIISSPKPDERPATTPAGLLSAHLRPCRPVMSATAYAPISGLSPALT